MEEKKRYRCVVCGKLRSTKFLRKIENSWVCTISITGRDYVFVPFKNKNVLIHPCKIGYAKSKFLIAKKAIDNYNELVINNKEIWFLIESEHKIDTPEPTFFLQ